MPSPQPGLPSCLEPLYSCTGREPLIKGDGDVMLRVFGG